MTGAVAAAAYSVIAGGGAPPATVQLHDQEIDSVAYNATATATYAINSNGSVTSTTQTSFATLETWLTGTGAASSSYEVNATLSGASVSGTLGTWLNCGSNNAWTLVNAARNNSVTTAVLSVQIRDVATHTLQASAAITLSAESDSRFG